MALVRVKLKSLGVDGNTNMPVMILTEEDGERTLEIWIGPAEATAIATRVADLELDRPLTHDLLASALRGLGGKLDEVVITRVEQSTYHAELRISRDGDPVILDARPSDAVALALRLEAEILVDEALLGSTAVELDEPGSDSEEPDEPEAAQGA